MMGPGLSSLSSYAAVVGSAHGPLIPAGPSARIIPVRAEELFYTVDFGRVKHNKGMAIVNPAALRKKIEEV